MQRLPFITQRLRTCGFVLCRQRSVSLDNLNLLVDIATQYDVGTTTRHIGRNRDHLRAASLRNDLRLARVLLGIEHVVRQFFFV